MNKHWNDLIRGLLTDGDYITEDVARRQLEKLQRANIKPYDEWYGILLDAILAFRKQNGGSPSIHNFPDYILEKGYPGDCHSYATAAAKTSGMYCESANFNNIISTLTDDMHRNMIIDSLVEAQEINNRTEAQAAAIEKKTRKKVLWGSKGFQEFMQEHLFKLNSMTASTKLSAVLGDEKDHEWFIDNLSEVHATVVDLGPVDTVRGGMRDRDITAVLGSAGHGKSTLTRYLLYMMMNGGKNVLYISVEEELRDLMLYFYLLHANNPELHKQKGVSKVIANGVKYVGTITRDAVLRKELSQGAKVYFEEVVKDFNNMSGKLEVLSQAALTIAQVESHLHAFNARLKRINRTDREKNVVDVLSIDYPGIMEASGQGARFDNPNAREDHIWQQLTNLSKQFNDHEGVTLVCPHQANRQGLKDAKKAGGYVDTTAVSSAHAVERNANLVLSLFPVPENQTGRYRTLKIQSLKTRASAKIPDFLVKIDGPTGWISVTAEEVPAIDCNLDDENNYRYEEDRRDYE